MRQTLGPGLSWKGYKMVVMYFQCGGCLKLRVPVICIRLLHCLVEMYLWYLQGGRAHGHAGIFDLLMQVFSLCYYILYYCYLLNTYC